MTPTAARARRGSDHQAPKCVDVMGYHDAREIPNYWTYAENFVLQDHMFEPNASWSLPAHLFMVSEWSARCSNATDPYSCTSALQNPNPDYKRAIGSPSNATATTRGPTSPTCCTATTSAGRYYVFKGTEPDCEDDSSMTCAPVKQGPQTPGIWNPLPDFTDVRQDGQMGNIQSLTNFFTAAKHGDAAGRLVDRPQRRPCPSIRPRWSAPARPT